MRKMVPSEIKGVKIEQITRKILKTGWTSDAPYGVTVFSYEHNITDLNIKDGDILIVTPTTEGNDNEGLLLSVMRNGLTFFNNGSTLFCYSLINPSTIQTDLTEFDIQLTIFRQSTL